MVKVHYKGSRFGGGNVLLVIVLKNCWCWWGGGGDGGTLEILGSDTKHHSFHPSSFITIRPVISVQRAKYHQFWLSIGLSVRFCTLLWPLYASGTTSPACLSVCKVLAPKRLCTLYPPSKIMKLFHRSLKQVVNQSCLFL